jgi:hypothetical protein
VTLHADRRGYLTIRGGCLCVRVLTSSGGLEREPRHVRPQGVLCPSCSHSGVQESLRVDLTLETRQERGRAGLRGCAALGVECVGANARSQGPLLGGKRKRHRRALSHRPMPGIGAFRDRWRPQAAICPVMFLACPTVARRSRSCQ